MFLPAICDLIERRIRAHVVQGIAVADIGDVARQVSRVAERLVGPMQQVAGTRSVTFDLSLNAIGLARDQVDRTRGRWTELRGVVVVVQREVLGVVPQRG